MFRWTCQCQSIWHQYLWYNTILRNLYKGSSICLYEIQMLVLCNNWLILSQKWPYFHQRPVTFFQSTSSYSVDFSIWRISCCPDATGLYSFENVQLSSLRAYWCDIEWEKMTRQFSVRCVYKIDFPIAFQFSTHKRQNVWTRFSNWISIMDFFVEIQWPFIPIWS